MCFLRLQCWSEENSHRSQLKYLIFSWTKSTCSFSSLIWQAENWHSAHLNRLGSLWTAAIWHLSWLLFAAEYVQRSHLNLKSFSDPCTALTCSLRCGFRPKVLSHTWHWKGFTFSWTNLTCFFTAEMDERVFSQIGQTEDISAANRLSSVQRPSGSWRKMVNETPKCDQIVCQHFLRIFLLDWLSKMTSNRRTCVFALIRWSPQSIKQINIWLFLQQRSGNCILISL